MGRTRRHDARERPATPGPSPERERREPPLVALQRGAGNRAVGSLLGSRVPRTASRVTVQRFDTDEHEWLGRVASSGGTVAVTADYRLTYGEMVAMAGDYFSSLQQMRALAARPGPGAGTRDELEYVRRVKVHGEKLARYDDEFVQPDPGSGGTFGSLPQPNPSHAAKKAADARYYALAGKNQAHFLDPKGEGGVLADPEAVLAVSALLEAVGIPPSDVLSGAASNYRHYHVTALRDATVAGQTGGSIDDAMAAEAFGGHFLTDSFSAGHVRTPRTSISEHWNPKVPLFPMKLEGYIAERLAEDLQAHEYSWRVAGIPVAVREDVLFGVALGKVREALSSKGQLGFADLVAGALHDYENARGVPAAVETDNATEIVTLFGDEHLGQGREEELAVRALQLGIREVQSAYQMGLRGGSVQATLRSLASGGRFAPEAAMPHALPDSFGEADQARIRWDHPTVDDLLADTRFQEAMRIFFTAKKRELEDATASLDPAQAAAFRRTVTTPLESKPEEVIRAALAWTPDTGGGALGHNTDDNALDFVQAAKRAGGLDTLTLAERRRLVSDLLAGATVGDDEDAIMDLLRTAPRSDQRALIDEFGWERLHDEIDDLFGEEFAEQFPASTYR